MILTLTEPVTIETSNHFDKWFKKFKDKQAQGKIHIILRKAEVGDLGEVKALSGSLYEKKLMLGLDIDFISLKLEIEFYYY